MKPTTYKFFATVPKDMELMLADELTELGAYKVRQTVAGVYFDGPLELGYRACLWSRLANAVLLPLKSFYAPTPEALYEGVREIVWKEHMDVGSTLAVTFHSSRSKITHTHFGALKVKDAIVDQFRDEFGERPSVDTQRPDLHINVHVAGDEATVSIDLSGQSLHRRAYREEKVKAPLKENVAAAILLRAGWPALAGQGRPLFDPMCGSATLLIEGALMAADIAPGLQRTYWGFTKWLEHDEALWNRLVKEALTRRKAGLGKLPPIEGFDREFSAVKAARANIKAAGLNGRIRIDQRGLHQASPSAALRQNPGLIVVNPPYGERLGTTEHAERLHAQLGELFKAEFDGWQATVITGDKELGRAIGLRASKVYSIYNGPIKCLLLNIDINEDNTLRPLRGRS